VSEPAERPAPAPAEPELDALRFAVAAPARAGPARLLALQHAAGNTAVTGIVTRALQRQPVEAPAAAPEATDRPTLRQGMASSDVRTLKLELNAAGADPSLSTSIEFDAATQTALTHFQRQHQLTPDGVAGPKTWGKLDFIARDRVLSKEEVAEFAATLTAAGALMDARDFTGAKALLLTLYRKPNASPEIRHLPTFDLGSCEHHEGNFDAAISYYQEFLDLPSLDAMGRRDATERLRQARDHQPPGKLESQTTKEREAALAA
jgi:putative peptidoglycan binding protein